MYIPRKGNCNGYESSTHSRKKIASKELSKILLKLRFILESGSSPEVMAPSVAHCPSFHHFFAEIQPVFSNLSSKTEMDNGVIKITSLAAYAAKPSQQGYGTAWIYHSCHIWALSSEVAPLVVHLTHLTFSSTLLSLL